MPKNVKGGEHIACFVMCSSEKEAELISGELLDKRLIACANRLSGVRSIFHWQGTKQAEEEVLLIFKSKKNLFKEICSLVKKLHSYEVPEIIRFDIGGDTDYLSWIDAETKS